MDITMDLRHLRYFIAVAEEGHVTRAAARLGLQQPPLSRLIKGMEKELDVQLFRRKSRGIELTEAGSTFLDKARSTIAIFEQAIVTAKRTARGEQGRIRVGVAPTASFHPFVPPVICAFRDRWPSVSVVLDEAGSDLLANHLRHERVDAAFLRYAPAETEGLVLNKLLDEELTIAIQKAHPLDQAKGHRDASLPLKALCEEPFIMVGRSPGLYAITISACRAAGFDPLVAQEIPHAPSALGYVAAGVGTSIIPASLRRIQIRGVSFYRITGSVQPKFPLILASRRGDPSAVVRNFISLAQRSARNFSA